MGSGKASLATTRSGPSVEARTPEGIVSVQDQESALSVVLAALDLASGDAPVFAALIAREATITFDAVDAVVWRCRDNHPALVLDQAGRVVRVVRASGEDLASLMSSPSLRPVGNEPA